MYQHSTLVGLRPEDTADMQHYVLLSVVVASTQANEAKHKQRKQALRKRSMHGAPVTLRTGGKDGYPIVRGPQYWQAMMLEYRMFKYSAHQRKQPPPAHLKNHTVSLADLFILRATGLVIARAWLCLIT